MYFKRCSVHLLLSTAFLLILVSLLEVFNPGSYAQKETKTSEGDVNLVLGSQDSIIALIHDLKHHIDNKALHSFWENFSACPFALYNSEKVYLTDSLIKPEKEYIEKKGVFIFDWDKRFAGNTSIDFNGETIAIWNLDATPFTSSQEKLYSSIIHEMFHVFQNKSGDKRFGNELLYPKFPFTVKNIVKRHHERQYLVLAVMEEDQELKREYVSTFIGYRESRRKDINDFLDYELGQESREGTARYVENKAYKYLSKIPDKFLISMYGRDLWDYPRDFTEFRHSCYSSGMYICLLLDEFCPDWKSRYMESEDFLYDFFKAEMNLKYDASIEVEDTKVAEFLITHDRKTRERAIQDFHTTAGYKIIISGPLNLGGFDPMNLVSLDNFVLHRNFIGFSLAGNSYFIQKPVLTIIGQNILDLKEVIFFYASKPEINGNLISFEKIGGFKGKIEEIEGGYRIELD